MVVEIGDRAAKKARRVNASEFLIRYQFAVTIAAGKESMTHRIRSFRLTETT